MQGQRLLSWALKRPGGRRKRAAAVGSVLVSATMVAVAGSPAAADTVVRSPIATDRVPASAGCSARLWSTAISTATAGRPGGARRHHLGLYSDGACGVAAVGGGALSYERR
jgi:hypothetical protein